MKKKNRPCHLEIVLGKRGKKREIEALAAFRDFTKLTQFIENGQARHYYELDRSSLLAQSPLVNDPNALLGSGLLNRYLEDDSSQTRFHVPRYFAEALSKVDKPFPEEHLPESSVFYFDFPSGVKDESGDVWGAYAFIGRYKNFKLRALNPTDLTQVKDNEHIFCVAYFNDSGTVGRLLVNITRQGNRIKTFAEEGEAFDSDLNFSGLNIYDLPEEQKKRRATFFQMVFNACLYATTADAEIYTLMPERKLTKKRLLKQRKEYGENLNSISLKVLNKDYRPLEELKDDKRAWSGHFRWQRCGEGLKKVKLTWVSPHTKTVKVKREGREEGASGGNSLKIF